MGQNGTFLNCSLNNFGSTRALLFKRETLGKVSVVEGGKVMKEKREFYYLKEEREFKRKHRNSFLYQIWTFISRYL